MKLFSSFNRGFLCVFFFTSTLLTGGSCSKFADNTRTGRREFGLKRDILFSVFSRYESSKTLTHQSRPKLVAEPRECAAVFRENIV